MGDGLLIGLPAMIGLAFLALAGLAGMGARALSRRADRRGVTGAWAAGGGALALCGLFAFAALFHAVTR